MKMFEFLRNAVCFTMTTLFLSPLIFAMISFIAVAFVAELVRELCDEVTFVCDKALTKGVDFGIKLCTLFERIRGCED